MILFSALHWNYYPVLWRVTQVLLDISAHYPWTMGMLLGDIHPSELERLDKPCAERESNLWLLDLQSTVLTTRPTHHTLLFFVVLPHTLACLTSSFENYFLSCLVELDATYFFLKECNLQKIKKRYSDFFPPVEIHW